MEIATKAVLSKTGSRGKASTHGKAAMSMLEVLLQITVKAKVR
jgi:hypothetical protein